MAVKFVSYLRLVAIWLLCFTATVFILLTNENLRDEMKPTEMSMETLKPFPTTWNYNNTWRSIGDASLKHKIYSAYFDKRTYIVKANTIRDVNLTVIGSIRIFAVLPLAFDDDITCILRSKNYLVSEVKAGVVRAIQENHGQRFSVFTVMCPLYKEHLTNSKVLLPQHVALQYMSNSLSHRNPTFIPISYPRDMDQLFAQPKPVLSICVGPLQKNYGNALRIVEFVEMYRILGATHFYFYYMDSTPDVRRVLNYYRDKGLADIMEWNFKDHLYDIHYIGIAGTYNDCVYRANVVDNFRYAAVVDFDEIIMPLKYNSLLDFLMQCDDGQTAAFVFHHVFFIKRDSDDKSSKPETSINQGLYTQTKVRRHLEILGDYVRSKSIVNTQGIIEMGNHYPWERVPGFNDNVVDTNVCLLFHYRDQCINCQATLTLDYTARKYGDLIWNRVDDVCLNIFSNYKGFCPTN